MSFTQKLYEEHHTLSRGEGFSILKDDRGVFFSGVIGTGKKVLDIGCRDGALTQFFLEGNEVLGVDIDEKALARAEGRGVRVRPMDLMGDWHEIEGETYDAVVAGELLEHLFFPEEIVRKVEAHLIPGGTFTGSVPNAYSLKNRIRYLFGIQKNTPLSDPTHINQFSVASMKELLSGHFADVHMSGLGRYSRLAKLLPNWCAFDIVFVAKK